MSGQELTIDLSAIKEVPERDIAIVRIYLLEGGPDSEADLPSLRMSRMRLCTKYGGHPNLVLKLKQAHGTEVGAPVLVLYPGFARDATIDPARDPIAEIGREPYVEIPLEAIGLVRVIIQPDPGAGGLHSMTLYPRPEHD